MTTPDMPAPGIAFPDFPPGSVWLVGAGPGDPAHLTLLAVHALGRADAVLHDALVDPRVLALARPGALVEALGKRGGRPSVPQQEITGRLIALARQGLRVVRLKGGDPYVFGRGGEEALALAAAGVPFRAVPGVTAGLAAMGAAGIPATSRDTNHAVILATGHLAGLEPGSPGYRAHWAGLAATGQPILLYMAMRALPDIAEALIAGGLPGDTPVAVVAEATLPGQRVLDTTLAEAAAAAAAAGLATPAIVGIGAIVTLRRHLAGGG